MKRKKVGILTFFLLLPAVWVCAPSGAEPEEVQLELATSSEGVETCTSDLGWRIEVTTFRLAIRDLEFTIKGETHSKLRRELRSYFAPKAFAHAGHYAGGDITGELTGDFILDLTDGGGQTLGDALLLVGKYRGVNFTFRTATERDDLDDDDPLLGHTAIIEGVAKRDSERVDFTARLKVKDDTQMVGGPFELQVEEDTSVTLALRLYTVDPSEEDTLFDGIEFSELDDNGDGEVAISPGVPAHNILAKTLVRHDHYGVDIEK